MNQPATNAPQKRIIYPVGSILDCLEYTNLFELSQPLEVELGSGDGSFLVDYAAANPEHNFIGVERLLGRLRKIDRKGFRRGLKNLRAVRIECLYFMRYLLPGQSVKAIHIYFPDPWPKRRHRQNRLINEAFPSVARRVLTPEGVVFLRTDDQDYFEQMLAVFDASPLFDRVQTPEPLLAFKTDFERDFNARGIGTLAVAYRLKP